jgi:hypothetical protein
MKPCVSADSLTKLFSSDLKQAIVGITVFSSWIDSCLPELIESLDLTFKWVWVKLFEASNTQLVKAVIEFTDKLLDALSGQGYRLVEAEANLLLPVLCERSGHNNAQFRSMLRVTILKTLSVCEVRLLVNYLVHALNSRNSRTKAEVQDTLALVIKDHGMLLSPKEVKQIVVLVGGSDSGVRLAAIGVLAEIYRTEHSKRTWELIGEVSDKVKDLISQRFKIVAKEQGIESREESDHSKTFERSDISMNAETAEEVKTEVKLTDPSPSKLAIPTFTGRSSTRSQTSRKGEITPRSTISHTSHKGDITPKSSMSQRKGEITPRSSASSRLPQITAFPPAKEHPAAPRVNPFTEADSTEILAEPLSISPEPTAKQAFLEAEDLDQADEKLRDLIITIKNGTMSSKVDALVGVDSFLKGCSFSHLHALTTQANALVESITTSLATTFDRAKDSLPHRFAKYLLAVAYKVTCNRQVMFELNENTLGGLLNQTLQTMIVENLSKLGEKGEGEAMFKSLNNMILRILENAQPTLVLVIQLRLLRVYTVGNERLMGLILKCLLKYVQVLPRMADDIDLSYFAVVMRDIFNERPQKFDERVRRALVDLLEEMKRIRGPALSAAVPELEAWIAVLADSTTPAAPLAVRKGIPGPFDRKTEAKSEELSPSMNLTQPSEFDISRIQGRITALKQATGREAGQSDNSIMEIKSRLARMMQPR